MDALRAIQQELKAPKNQFNSFGKYSYRSAEDILEAVKPLLAKHGGELTISDEIIEVGGRIYVKATCRFIEGDIERKTTAFAREPLDKKGMDESQITGTASSYARKYALNGLFLIDDTKDADTDEHRQQINRDKPTEPKQAEPKISAATAKYIEQLISETGTSRMSMLKHYAVTSINDLTRTQAQECIDRLKARKNEADNVQG